MRTATRYACQTCGATKCLPESPESPPRDIRTGCDICETIRRHDPVGVGP